jgi:hypothetical protein
MSTSERGRVNASFRQQVWSLVPISSGIARIKNPGLTENYQSELTLKGPYFTIRICSWR